MTPLILDLARLLDEDPVKTTWDLLCEVWRLVGLWGNQPRTCVV